MKLHKFHLYILIHRSILLFKNKEELFNEFYFVIVPSKYFCQKYQFIGIEYLPAFKTTEITINTIKPYFWNQLINWNEIEKIESDNHKSGISYV